MISGKQIRAARVLVEWDAKDLAEKADLSLDSIFKIETGAVQPRGATVDKIIRAFASNGVEFTENSGVRLKPQNVEVLEGSAGFTRFYDVVYEYLNQHGGTVCVSGVDELLYVKHRLNAEEDAILHRKRMAELTNRRDDVRVKILVKEGDYNFVGSSYAEYRWQPAKHFSNASFYVFGNTLALISFVHDPAPLIIMIASAPFAEAYRQSFDISWTNAIKPPPQTAKKKQVK